MLPSSMERWRSAFRVQNQHFMCQRTGQHHGMIEEGNGPKRRPGAYFGHPCVTAGGKGRILGHRFPKRWKGFCETCNAQHCLSMGLDAGRGCVAGPIPLAILLARTGTRVSIDMIINATCSLAPITLGSQQNYGLCVEIRKFMSCFST